MDPVTTGLLVVLGGSTIVGYVMYRRSSKKDDEKKAAKEKKRAERSIRNIRLKDIVTYTNQDFIVESICTFDQNGWKWKEFLLADGNDQWWLEVEDDDELFVGLVKEVDDLKIEGAHPPDQLNYDGVRYKQVERGEATITYEGAHGKRRGGACKYYDYDGEGDHYLSIEQFGESYEVYVGREIDESTVEILPGS
jgi:hypothetical protein